MNKKAIYFSLDALIATLVLVLGIASYSTLTINKESFDQQYVLANDLLAVFSVLTVSETNNSFVKDKINDGNITNLNNTILEQIGEFWAKNETELARDLIKNISAELIPASLGFGVWIHNETIYTKNISVSKSLASSRRMVSGYEKGKPVGGYVARAWATTALKNMTESFPFYVQGAGVKGGNGVTITKKFNLNASEIFDAIFYISIHYGISNINSMSFKINNNALSPNWTYIEERTEGGKTTHVAFGVADASSFVQIGQNTAEVLIKSQSDYPAYINPGMRLDVKYKKQSGLYQTSRKKTYYFDHILSQETGNKKSGAWAILPIHIEKNRELKSVIFHLKAEDIENVSNIPPGVPQYNVQIYLDNETVELF
ncbi:hypothetical protein KY312_03065, partial [Candidatus Woesearchaeota archaeon]|nr:hypothetical protein [Candidatus Woesearchaeota archaeon]